MSPTKMRLVADLMKGLPVREAEKQLMFSKKAAAKPLLKLLRSALANAENNFRLNKEVMFVKSMIVNQGFTLHRWQPKAFGRATPIRRKNSIVEMTLEERNPVMKETDGKIAEITKAKEEKKQSKVEKEEKLETVSKKETSK